MSDNLFSSRVIVRYNAWGATATLVCIGYALRNDDIGSTDWGLSRCSSEESLPLVRKMYNSVNYTPFVLTWTDSVTLVSLI